MSQAVEIDTLIMANTYQDSVKLMKIANKVSSRVRLSKIMAVVGTTANKEMLKGLSLLTGKAEKAAANDLIIVAAGETLQKCSEGLEAFQQLLSSEEDAAYGMNVRLEHEPRFLEDVFHRNDDECPLALISVAGTYAGYEAMKALNLGMHVHLFSDNVTIEDERVLKNKAVEQGLLMMGADCGTAILNGAALGFANKVNSGPVGIVGASGTGIQAVTCLIDILGSGITQAIGTGGRDLKDEIGGIMTFFGLDVLEADPGTSVIALVSKPAGPATSRLLEKRLDRITKPAIVLVLGGDIRVSNPLVKVAGDIEDAAVKAVKMTGQRVKGKKEADNPMERLAGGNKLQGCCIRGLFTGGTLADEALMIISEELGPVYSNTSLFPQWRLDDPGCSYEHSIIDLGDDLFTRGRAHPMIDPTLRGERLFQEFQDKETGVIICDIVCGYGSHQDPAGELARAVYSARRQTGRNDLPVIASVCATEKDPQPLRKQIACLKEAGIIVAGSSTRAARLACTVWKSETCAGADFGKQ